MIAQGIAQALRETAKAMENCADHLEVLGKLWIMEPTAKPPVVKTEKKVAHKGAAIRKELRSKRRKRPHWSQTPEGKARMSVITKERWAKKKGANEEANTPTTAS